MINMGNQDSIKNTFNIIKNDGLLAISPKLDKQSKVFFDKIKDNFSFIKNVRIYSFNN